MIPRTLTASITICAILAAPPSHAAITTDGRTGPVQSLSGQMTVPQELGTALGPNLFHSFATFGIDPGESVTFTAVNPFDNVISRVTGGAASTIDGPLSSSITNSVGGGANLWLINPAGIVFGPGASLFVAGSFHASTADVLNLGNCATDPGTCGQFRATDPDASSLAVAPPESFGFLGTAPAAIEANQAFIQVNLGYTLALTGGDISVDGGYWYAPGGSIGFNSAAGPGTLPVNSTAPATTVTDFGAVSLSGTIVDTNGFAPQGPFPGFPAGRIFIRGGTVVADASTIMSNHEGPAAGGGITLVGTETISVTNGTEIKIVNSGTGDPGTIRLQGGNVSIGDNSTVYSQAVTAGPSAPVIVSGTEIRLDTGGKISTFGYQQSTGDITLTATNDLSIDGSGPNSASITSGVLLGTLGDAGSIVMEAGGTVSLVSGARLSSQTAGAGQAGSVDVTADEIIVDGTLTPDRFTGITSQSTANATGNAGAVTLSGNAIRILGNSEVSSNTFSAGSAGSVTVNAETLLIDGIAGVTNWFTGISSGSEVGAAGNAGAVTVNAGSTTILGRGVISTNTAGVGTAGKVTLTGTNLLIDGRSTPESFTGISSDSTAGASGDAGTVDVSVDSITILGGGHVSSTTAGTGAGGQVNLTGGTILIDGTGAPVGITDVASRSVPGAAANAGSVAVHGDSITLRGAASISTSTYNGGDAGQVLVSGDTILVDGLDAPVGITGIFSQSNGGVSGNAGSVTVQGDRIEVRNGGVIGSNTDGGGDAGDITLSGDAGAPAAQVTLTGAGSRINSLSAGTGPDAGRAGRIDIAAERLALDEQAGILASTVDGAGGAVTLDTDTLTIEGGARVSAETSGSGNAGAIAIGGVGGSGTRTARVTVAGTGSSIVSSTAGLGDGGEVTIHADSLEVADGGSIAAASADVSSLRVSPTAASSLRIGPAAVSGPRFGQAGSITVDVTDLVVRDGGTIGTTSATSGGGNIVVLATGDVLLEHGAITASAQGVETGDSGGNVSIARPRFLILDAGEIRADANAGRGGNITIDAVGFVASADSIVSASSAQSVDGQVTNTSENTVGTLLEVEEPGVAKADPIRTRCTDTQVQNRSSLIVRETRPGMVRSPWLAADPAPGAVTARNLPCDTGTAAF